jgi:hypothetical protein
MPEDATFVGATKDIFTKKFNYYQFHIFSCNLKKFYVYKLEYLNVPPI